MASFIVSGNPKFFDVDKFIEDNHFIELEHSMIMSLYDVVYVYISGMGIRYKMYVSKVDIPENELYDDSAYYVNKTVRDKRKSQGHNYRFNLISKSNSEMLSLQCLENHDIKGFRGMKLVGEKLRYVESCFEYVDSEGIDSLGIWEGAFTKVAVNRYERNPIARQKCIEKNGCICAVCGMDFGKKYGEIGKGFIHVHHVVPISSIGEEYEIDCEKDLVPVCPNCHAMLHRGKNGHVYTVEELKGIMERQK